MAANPQACAVPRERTRGDVWESIAFTFCRAGTIVLFAQLVLGERYILPFVAFATALLYGIALAYGKRDTRCILRLPWVVILFWGSIGALTALLISRGVSFPALLEATR